eukprot:scaffold170024_cov15-Tisochrysis_lutea.AAC.1
MSVQSSAGVFTSMISDAAFRCCVGSKIGPPINSGKQPKLQAAQARAVLCIGTLGKERVLRAHEPLRVSRRGVPLEFSKKLEEAAQ